MKTEEMRVLTGDTPTGKLHLGHLVGSIENRLHLQETNECYFIIANTHAFTTRLTQPTEIYQSTLDIATDYLALGIDPKKSVIFVESDVPAIFELAAFFSMLVPHSRLLRNPTIKEELQDKNLSNNYSTGFLFYPLLQAADILACRADLIPVGEDQLPHLELTREIARRFNQLYCGVDPHLPDEAALEAGGLFPIPQGQIGRTERLVGLGGPNAEGRLLKMSKSLQNAIFLTDDPTTVRQKVMSMYTDPKRIRSSDPGTIDNNPLWIFHDVFNPDKQWVKETKSRYQAGTIGDVECKKKLVDVLITLLEPFQKRRQTYAQDPDLVKKILKEGAERANLLANQTLLQVKTALQQNFFP